MKCTVWLFALSEDLHKLQLGFMEFYSFVYPLLASKEILLRHSYIYIVFVKKCRRSSARIYEASRCSKHSLAKRGPTFIYDLRIVPLYLFLTRFASGEWCQYTSTTVLLRARLNFGRFSRLTLRWCLTRSCTSILPSELCFLVGEGRCNLLLACWRTLKLDASQSPS